ncbi:MAG: YdcF family protein [Cyanobacteria bacterium P01_A01_bin.135]
MAMLLCGIATAAMIAVDVYPLLAPNRPTQNAELLIVEGWLPDYALEMIATEFREGGYQLIVAMGSPLLHAGHLTRYSTFADLSAATLVSLGIDASKILLLPHDAIALRRTASAAQALKAGLQQAGITPTAANLCSLGPHTRRSWELFQAALPTIQLGVLALPPRDYDASRWWRTSSGARSVVGEMIAYTHHAVKSRLDQVL